MEAVAVQEIIRALGTLPPEQQAEVYDFVLFLQARYRGETNGAVISNEKDTQNLSVTDAKRIPFLGMYEDEPELIDEIVEEAMRAREERSLRLPSG